MLVHDKISGNGCLEFHDDTHITSTFSIHQHFDGALFLHCTCSDVLAGLRLCASNKKLRRLVGQTVDGRPVVTEGRLYALDVNGPDCTLAAGAVIIGDQNSAPSEHRFTLTNIAFPGVCARTMPAPVTLNVPSLPEPTTVVLAPHDEYQERERLQRHHKLAVPTATLSIASSDSIPATAELVGRLCMALSIVQGHKINWITHEVTDRSRTCCYKNLQDRVTKRSSGLALNRLSGNDKRLPLIAAQDCYASVWQRQEQYAWSGPVLEAWLEARTDADYLQTRALKFVTVVEALRSIVLRNQPRTHLPVPAWDAFLTYIIPATHVYLIDLKQSKQHVDAITTPARWEALNRKGFGSEITATLKILGVKEDSRTIGLFVNSRNKLIHEGIFRCESDPAIVAAEPGAPQNPYDEYLFIASFVDRVIMKAVGLHHYLITVPKNNFAPSGS